VDRSKSQRNTRSSVGRGVSQANEAAIYPKLTGLCQHEIVSGNLRNWKYCGTVQAIYGCLVGHVFMGVRISVFAPLICNTSVLGLDDYADRCLFEKGADWADWYPFCLGGGTGMGIWEGGGVPQGCAPQKIYVPSQKGKPPSTTLKPWHSFFKEWHDSAVKVHRPAITQTHLAYEALHTHTHTHANVHTHMHVRVRVRTHTQARANTHSSDGCTI